jgi:Mg/Co/Ni transporter MgtE
MRRRRRSGGHGGPAGGELDISRATAGMEIRRRIPWMFLALVAGVVMVLLGRQFEDVISKNLKLALFVPVIVTGMVIPVLFAKLKPDPVPGTDEITTALSDDVSLLIYLVSASLLVFSR